MTQLERNTIGAVIRALDNITVRGGESVKTLAAVMNTLTEMVEAEPEKEVVDDGNLHAE
jgi:hypothetical protein